MVYFFHRGGDTRICETRSAPDGPGYELVITDGRRSSVERFQDPRTLENRQDELRHAWLLHGWRAADCDAEMDESG
jgi:hypothetical protein